jgi:hypothetical protein
MEFTKSVSETSEFATSPSTDSTSDTSAPPSEARSALEEVTRSGQSDGMQQEAGDGNGTDACVDGDDCDGEEDSGSVYRPNAEDDEVTARLGPAAPRFYDWKEFFGFLKVFKENHDVLVKEMQSYSRAWADWPETNLYSVSVLGNTSCISIRPSCSFIALCEDVAKHDVFPSGRSFAFCAVVHRARICQTLRLLSVASDLCAQQSFLLLRCSDTYVRLKT